MGENCPHSISEWMSYMWEPGHYAGKVKVCERCNRIMETGEEMVIKLKKRLFIVR